MASDLNTSKGAKYKLYVGALNNRKGGNCE